MEANNCSASGFEKPTRKRKKPVNDPKTTNFPMEAVTHSHPYNAVLGHSETSTHQHHIHIPGYCPSYYQVGNAFTPPSFGPFFGASDHGQGTYPENATQSFDANPNNMFSGTHDH